MSDAVNGRLLPSISVVIVCNKVTAPLDAEPLESKSSIITLILLAVNPIIYLSSSLNIKGIILLSAGSVAK